MKFRVTFVAIASFAALSTIAGAQRVSTDYDHKAPFSDYKTFSFHKLQTENPLDVSVIREEIRMDLTYHGWREVPRGGDIAVTAIGGQRSVQQYQTFYNGLGPGYGWGGWGGWYGGGWGGGSGIATTTQRTIPIGTLVVDLYDTRTHNLVWRGTSQATQSHRMDKNSGKLQKAIDEMFYKFPPKHAM